MYKLGLTSISFRQLSYSEVICAARSAGLSVIEWGSDVHAPRDDKQRLNEIAAADKAAGIECSSYGTYFKLGVDKVEELYEYIEAAKILGTNILRIWCGQKNYTDMTEDERLSMIEEGRKAAKIAEECSAILCMECHNNTYTNCPEGALRLMKEVDSPAFRMYWQPNQNKDLEYNLEYARAIHPYTYNLHVFYWIERDKRPLIEGAQYWKEYLKLFPEDRALLFEFMPDGKPETLITEAQALRKIVEGKI